MIAWLLARPKLIAYGLGALALAGGLWWVAHRVSQWREAYRERPALVAERDAARAERTTTERALLDQAERNRRLEHDTNDALRRAGIAARDIADGLRRHYARLPRPICPAAPAAGDPHGTAGEPADGDGVAAATERHLEACARDAERLNALQGYVRALPARAAPASATSPR